MRDQTWFNVVAAIVVLAVVVGGGLALFATPSSPSAAKAPAGSSTPTVYRNLTISYDPTLGDFAYSTRQLSVPLHVLVVFTITSYDTSAGLLPSTSDAMVQGTYDGSMSVASAGQSFTATALPTSDVAHTFTMSDAFYHLNVPIPPARSPALPVQVTFTVEFGSPGTYAWGCVVICGLTGMPTGMYGYITAS